jgi:hypothetical protein
MGSIKEVDVKKLNVVMDLNYKNLISFDCSLVNINSNTPFWRDIYGIPSFR